MTSEDPFQEFAHRYGVQFIPMHHWLALSKSEAGEYVFELVQNHLSSNGVENGRLKAIEAKAEALFLYQQLSTTYRSTNELEPRFDGTYSLQSSEGISLLNDQLITYRNPTIRKIYHRVELDTIILIRAPPLSGKTSLVKLLDYDLRKKGHHVFSISLLGLPDPIPFSDSNLRNDVTFDDFWKQETRKVLGEATTWQQLLSTKSYIIIDEAQILYSRAKLFWETIKKLVQVRNELSPLVIFFAAYGEGSTGAISTPINFPNSLNFVDISVTDEELLELFRNYDTIRGSAVPLNDDMKNFVIKMTGKHIGLIIGTLNYLYDEMRSIKSNKPREQLSYLLSRKFINQIQATRAVPDTTDERKRPLIQEEKSIIMSIIDNDNYRVEYDRANPHMNRLIRDGFLINDNTYLSFASPLIKDIFVARLLSAPLGDQDFKTNDMNSFIENTIRKMRNSAIINSLSRSPDGTLLERHWQNEFYRAASLSLGNRYYISPDVGRVFGSSGFIDFYINGTLKWAIEITREGDKIKEHEERFTKGIYKTMIDDGNIVKYGIIDFRNNSMEIRNVRPDFWYVLYDLKGSDSVDLIHQNNKKTIHFSL